MFGRKKVDKGIVLQELCQFVSIAVLWLHYGLYIVKSTSPRTFSVSLEYFAGMLQTYLRWP